ncbi:MAG: TRAP transporter small permease subunit [Kiloniellales bacterium]
MSGLKLAAEAIGAFNERLGRLTAWLALFMVLIQFVVVLMRYVFGVGSIAMQESIVYMHGVLFMVGAGYTLLHDGHVRVDIFYREAHPRTKAIIDLLGSLFLLLPVVALIWIYSLPYVTRAWSVLEGSKETSGIQGVYLLKTVVLAFCVLVALQGIALAIRSLLVLLDGASAVESRPPHQPEV